MMLNAVSEHFDLWGSAHTTKSTSGRGSSSKLDLHGIKKLRELILELAVRGKLVPQNPEDEPASVLLERVAAEKARLVKEEKLKTKASLIISDDDKYIRVPDSWDYCRLGNLAKFIDYRGKTPKKISAGVRLITAKNIRFGYISSEPEEFISEEEYDEWMTRGFPRKGDLLFTPEAPLGNVAIIDIDEKFALAQRAICFQLHEQATALFLKILIMSAAFQLQLKLNATGMTATGIKASKLKEIPIPIPPQAEIERIVAKVNELMALCDQLEKQQTDCITAHQTLVEELLATLTNSTTADEVAENWARIAEHFDTLFTTDHSVDQLKQTVLQLAVMGRLVPQNPEDEPASVLLEKIAAEKAQLVKDKKIKKQKPLPAITDEEKPFVLPEGWEWCRVEDLSLHSEAGWSPKCENTARERDDWGVLKVSAVTWGEFRDGENKQLPDHLEPKPEYEVQPNDFLISRANTAELVARSVVVPEDAPTRLMMSDKIIRFVFSDKVSSRYVNLVNNSCYARQYYATVAGGTSSSMKNVSRKQIQMLLIAMPPKNEQLRIESRFNEMMTLCDTLKSQIHQTQTTQLHLANAMVEQAVA